MELECFVYTLMFLALWMIRLCHFLRTRQRHGRRRRGMGYRTKGANTSCTSLWRVRQSICLFETEAESLLKIHSMFECEVLSWQHMWFSVEISTAQSPRHCLYSYEKDLVQRPSQTGPCGAEVDRPFSERSREVSAARPHKIRVGQAVGFNSNIKSYFQVPYCSPYQKESRVSRLLWHFLNPDCDGIFLRQARK